MWDEPHRAKLLWRFTTVILRLDGCWCCPADVGCASVWLRDGRHGVTALLTLTVTIANRYDSSGVRLDVVRQAHGPA